MSSIFSTFFKNNSLDFVLPVWYTVREVINTETPKKPLTRTEINRRWNLKNLDRIEFTVPKGEKAVIVEAAQKVGLSMNAYINDAVKEKMERNS